jgi:hypothetical protein
MQDDDQLRQLAKVIGQVTSRSRSGHHTVAETDRFLDRGRLGELPDELAQIIVRAELDPTDADYLSAADAMKQVTALLDGLEASN